MDLSSVFLGLKQCFSASSTMGPKMGFIPDLVKLDLCCAYVLSSGFIWFVVLYGLCFDCHVILNKINSYSSQGDV